MVLTLLATLAAADAVYIPRTCGEAANTALNILHRCGGTVEEGPDFSRTDGEALVWRLRVSPDWRRVFVAYFAFREDSKRLRGGLDPEDAGFSVDAAAPGNPRRQPRPFTKGG